MAEPSRVRRQLGAELHKLRRLAGLTQRTVAKVAGVSQSTVVRVERGEQLLPRRAVEGWLAEAGADEEAVSRVLALLEAAHTETKVWSDLLAEEAHLQDTARERERASKWVRNFQPTVIPGLLQTAEYARAVLELGHTLDPAAAVTRRLERQQILYEPGRRFSFLIAESALRWSPAPGALRGLADRIESLATLESVELGVVPASSAEVLAWSNFVLHELHDGGTYVTIELIHGQLELRDPGMVALYEGTWRDLWSEAAVGPDAVEFVRQLGR